ncbi:MAG: NapC/NirT family cytochrome c [Actinomycetota bacterium]
MRPDRRAVMIGAALFVLGVIVWGAFNTAMEATNTLDFCVTCHEMRDTVFQEYKGTVHYTNRSGVRAGCPDCHVPRPWVWKVVRKVQASNELYHALRGTIDTPEKFEAHRLELAQRVWAAMKATDSRECRNCHGFDAMNAETQRPRARAQHAAAAAEGQTCIDCHKGIAHKPVHAKLEAPPTDFDISQ